MTRVLDQRERLRPIPKCRICGGNFYVCGRRISKDGTVLMELDCICGNRLTVLRSLRGVSHVRG